MATAAFLTISGAKQGQIKGGTPRKAHAGKIEVTAWTFGGELAGGNQGAAVAGDFFLAKTVDESSPPLFQMMFFSEDVSSFLLEVLEVDQKTGAEVVAQTWKLSGARMTSIRQSGIGVGATVPDQEELTFAFSNAEYRDVLSNRQTGIPGSLA